MKKDERNIKNVFEEHISRVGAWPPSWSDVEDAIREAYWAGSQAASSSVNHSPYEDASSLEEHEVRPISESW